MAELKLESPRKTYCVRIDPELHELAMQNAQQLGLSFSDILEEALLNILEVAKHE